MPPKKRATVPKREVWGAAPQNAAFIPTTDQKSTATPKNSMVFAFLILNTYGIATALPDDRNTMNKGKYATKKCWTCGNELNGRCKFCYTPRKSKRLVNKKNSQAVKQQKAIAQESIKAKTAYRKIMEAQEFWMKNI